MTIIITDLPHTVNIFYLFDIVFGDCAFENTQGSTMIVILDDLILFINLSKYSDDKNIIHAIRYCENNVSITSITYSENQQVT